MMADQQENLQAFLTQPNVAVLATVDDKGRPHAAPVWYLYQDGVFVISTGRGSQKHRNIERNPEVTLVIDRRALPYYAVMAQGRAEVGPGPTEAERLKLATHYIGEELARRYVARTSGGQNVTIRLRARKLIEYNGQAGRT
jgi:PPOX class probable F420-dependent enzyme